MDYNKMPFIISAPLYIFHEEFNNEQYRGSLLTLKDCFEGILKFYSSLLFSDAINQIFEKQHMRDQEVYQHFIDNLKLLFSKPPSNGDWVSFYFNTAILLNTYDLTNQLLFPEVVYLVCKPKQSRCKTRVAKAFHSFIKWRNSKIGHGTAGHDLEKIKESLEEQKELLDLILAESKFIEDLSMYSYTPSGSKMNWVGASLLDSYESEFMLEQDTSIWLQRKGKESAFSISPLIISSLKNNKYSLLTYDKIGNGVFFLDSFYGTKIRFPKLLVIEKWLNQFEELSKIKLLQSLSNRSLLDNPEEIAYTRSIIRAFEEIEFGSETKNLFVPPEYLISEIESTLSDFELEHGKGIIHIIGNGGTGKSWLAHALNKKKHFSYASEVLKYHIRIGMRQNIELFIDSIGEQVRQEGGHQVHTRIRFEEYDNIQEAFADYLDEILDKSEQDRLILVIDGLDELVIQKSEKSILGLLPQPDSLPDGVYLLLLSRPDNELRGAVKKVIEGISVSPYYSTINMSGHPDYRNKLFDSYLQKKLNVVNEDNRNRIIEIAGDSFLMVSLLGKLLENDNNILFTELPLTVSDAYMKYLETLQKNNGELIFTKLYLKVFLLIAFSPNPLNLYQISDLTGIASEKILFALYDIGNFFEVHRDQAHNTFSIAHNKFTEFMFSNYSNELKMMVSELIDGFIDDDGITQWLIKGNINLQYMGSTELSIHLSEGLLEKLDKDSEDWIKVMYSYIDMIHIKGNYEKAAQMYGELANQLITGFGYQKSSESYLKCKLRQAHHLKFVAKIQQPKVILEEIKQFATADSMIMDEIDFMLYGSIGCLSNPDQEKLNGLTQLANRLENKKEEYLLSRCLRRISDLQIKYGQLYDAKQTVYRAIELAEKNKTRQRIYLYSTEAEIFRMEGDLKASLKGHTYTYQYAIQRGLNGWTGHALLGLSETHRMLGEKQQALEYADEALLYYEKANKQRWGMIHSNISKYFITGNHELASIALQISKEAGYEYDYKYIQNLLNNKSAIRCNHHNHHYLLFP